VSQVVHISTSDIESHCDIRQKVLQKLVQTEMCVAWGLLWAGNDCTYFTEP